VNLRQLSLVAIATVLGCGDTVSVGNNNPKGLVGGVIVDAASEMPLAGATVHIVSADATVDATADMNGVWQAKDVPAGSIIVTLSQMGYVTATFNATLSGAVGNFPVANPTLTLGPIGLIPSTGAFNVRLVDENGAAVSSVHVVAHTSARYVDFSSGGPVGQGGLELPGISDDNGLVVFTGLPDFSLVGAAVSSQILVDVAAMKVMGTESYSFLGGTFTFDLRSLPGSTPTIVLAGPKTPLTVLDSNVDYLRVSTVGTVGSIVPVAGPITVAFNQAINPDSVRASFFTEDGKQSSIVATPSVSTNLLTITPSTALPSGQRFNLSLHAIAAQPFQGSSGEFDAIAPFFTAPTGSGPSTVTTGVAAPHIDVNRPPTTLVFTLDEPIGQGRGIAGPVDCVAFYENIQFDNDANTAFMGEYDASGNPASMVCTSSPGPALNVTRISPVGEGLYGVVTGFTTKWAVQYDSPGAGGCSPLVASCTKPTSGTRIHLVFSKLDPSSTVRRVSGEAVSDQIVVVIP
jgi:hypothetical protein